MLKLQQSLLPGKRKGTSSHCTLGQPAIRVPGCELRFVSKLEKVSDRLTNTLNDLAEAIKIKQQVIQSDTIDLKLAIKEVLAMIDADIKHHHAMVKTNFNIPEIQFPKIYFESVLANLLSNSLKYKKENVPPSIVISTYTDPTFGYTVMEYEDNGIGIDLNVHGKSVFGLYKTFSPRNDAHGVGLFLVKTQVESQGDEILIESTPGIGTIFKILFKGGGNCR
jgi:signal transduction histidine kinase